MLIRSLSYSPTSATRQSGNTVIIAHGASSPAPTEPTATTTGSPVCPSANRTTYTATNKPVTTFLAETELTNSSFKFEIVCNTNYFGGSITDLQTMSNVSSLGACIDACALCNWQVSPGHSAALGCTGIESTTRPAWRPASGEFATTLPDVCILKNGITQSSVNLTNKGPGWDGAILLFT